MAFTVNILLQNGHHESNDHQVLRVEDFRFQENCIYYFPQKIFVRYNLQC